MLLKIPFWLVLATLTGCASTPGKPTVAHAGPWAVFDRPCQDIVPGTNCGGTIEGELRAGVMNLFSDFPRAAPWDADWTTEIRIMETPIPADDGPGKLHVRFRLRDKHERTLVEVDRRLTFQRSEYGRALRDLLLEIVRAIDARLGVHG